MIKKRWFILCLLIVIFSFSSASAQNYDIFYELIGKSKDYIDKNFPDAEVMPFYSDFFAGYTEVGAILFEDDSSLSILVSYNTQKTVKSVALVSMGVFKSHDPNLIYEALNYYAYYYGFPFRENTKSGYFEVTSMTDTSISGIIAGKIQYTVRRRYVNFKLFYLAEAEYINK